MRSILLAGVLGLLSAQAGAGGPAAGDEVRFGIDVARKGLWQEARFRFERALQIDPQSANAYNNLGVALEQQGEFTQARQAYEKALELAPGSLYIQQNYDLFREADDKRNRKAKKRAAPQATPTPTPEPAPSPQP